MQNEDDVCQWIDPEISFEKVSHLLVPFRQIKDENSVKTEGKVKEETVKSEGKLAEIPVKSEDAEENSEKKTNVMTWRAVSTQVNYIGNDNSTCTDPLGEL
jgi:hypothetical protein